MRTIDFHAHFFSLPFFDTLAALSPLPGDPAGKLADLADKTGIELPPDDIEQHVARWLGELEAHEVEHLVAFASVPQEIPALAEARALAGGRITPMALVDPLQPGAAERVSDLLGDGGFGGVLLFPAMHHFRLHDDAVRPLLEVLGENAALCYVHCGLLIVKLRDLLGILRFSAVCPPIVGSSASGLSAARISSMLSTVIGST